MTELNLDALRDPETEIRAQQIFDAVWQYFVVENAPRSMRGSRCMYRSDAGSCCAVGLFLPDDLARELDALAETSVTDVEFLLPRKLQKYTDLLSDLQDAHDHVWGRAPRDVSLCAIACEFGLKVPV